MEKYKVPVRKEVPAYAEVEMEANSLEEACLRVQKDLREHGADSEAANAEFTADWGEAYDLKLADVMLPDGRKFTTENPSE